MELSRQDGLSNTYRAVCHSSSIAGLRSEQLPEGSLHLSVNSYLTLSAKSVSFLLSGREDIAKALT